MKTGILVYHKGCLCVVTQEAGLYGPSYAMPALFVRYYRLSSRMSEKRVSEWLEPMSWINPAHVPTWQGKEVVARFGDHWEVFGINIQAEYPALEAVTLDFQAPQVDKCPLRFRGTNWEKFIKTKKRWEFVPTRLAIYPDHCRFETMVKNGSWRVYGDPIWLPHQAAFSAERIQK